MSEKLSAFTKLLAQYIGFKSVSTDPAFISDINAQVNWLVELFTKSGFSVRMLRGPNTNPLILAEYYVSDTAKTKLIYGHYDVQPAALEDGWKADPFTLREEGGRFIGRGVVDNKGQNLIHVFTAIELIREGRLGCNVKFLLEGNEETANDDLAGQVAQYAEELKCDEIIISDGEILGDTPTIEESLRGGGNLTLTFRTAKNDLHSGLYGSGVPSAAKELIAFLAKMLLPDGAVTIPGFYDAVDAITPEQTRRNLALLTVDDPVSTSTAKTTVGRHDFYTMVGIWPAVEVSGISSGYAGSGYKNIIPAVAVAKINFRLVASQRPEAVAEMFKKYAAENIPRHIEYDLVLGEMCLPVKVDVTAPAIARIMELQEKIYGAKPVVRNVGGGIPVVADFQRILKTDPILLSLGNTDCNMHGAEENFRIDLVEKGLALSELLLGKEG